MSHCWNQDGNVFSVVCSVVIGVGITVALISICCIVKIVSMAKKVRHENKKNKNRAEDQLELQEYSIHI